MYEFTEYHTFGILKCKFQCSTDKIFNPMCRHRRWLINDEYSISVSFRSFYSLIISNQMEFIFVNYKNYDFFAFFKIVGHMTKISLNNFLMYKYRNNFLKRYQL